MYEVVIIQHGPKKWEWRVCDSSGRCIIVGWETTRAEARYRGNRALFTLLLGGRPLKAKKWARKDCRALDDMVAELLREGSPIPTCGTVAGHFRWSNE